MRPATVTEPAQKWVMSLPYGTWFTAASVPGPRNAVYVMLHRLLAEPSPIISRAARGVYWRQYPSEHPLYGTIPLAPVEPVVAPKGSGWSGWSALADIGWTTQRPARDSVAVPVRGIKPPKMFCEWLTPIYVYRPNKRRLELNWGEATVLDAVRHFGWSDCLSWDHALSNLQELGPRDLDMCKVFWAAETERCVATLVSKSDGHEVFAKVITKLKADLLDRSL